MEWLTTATTSALDLMSTVITTITGNSILALLFAIGVIIPAGIGLFRKFRR